MRQGIVLSVAVLALAVVLALPAGSRAGKKAQTQPAPASQEQAKALLEKACKALNALKGFSVHADVTLDKVYSDGSKIQTARSMDILSRRPDAFRVVTDGDDLKALSVFDGKVFTLALPERKVYGRIGFAGDTEALLDELARTYGLESPLGDLLSGDPCASLTYVAAYNVGKSRVRGVACDHLFFQGKDVDWQLWVEEGGSGLPRKFVITEKKLPKAPQFTAEFSDWKAVDSPADAFAFTPAEGLVRDDAVITGRAQGGR